MIKLSYLKKIPLFSKFSERDLQKLMKIGKVEGFNAGERIFREGTVGDKLYVVLSGMIKIYTEAGSNPVRNTSAELSHKNDDKLKNDSITGQTVEGAAAEGRPISNGAKKKTLAYLEKGEFFGEMALVDMQPRSASSVAMEPSGLFVIKKKDFQKLFADHPGISLQFIKTLSRRLREADKEIESLAFGDVLGRIASTLLQLSAKYGVITKDGCTIKMPLNHRDIAEIAGTGREMVSRTLNRFRRLKIIDYNEQYLMVIDAQKLKVFSSTGGLK